MVKSNTTNSLFIADTLDRPDMNELLYWFVVWSFSVVVVVVLVVVLFAVVVVMVVVVVRCGC